MKTVKSALFKKYLKRRESRVRFCLSLGWLNITEKKMIEHYNSVGAGVHKVGKVVFRPTLTLIFGKCEKGKLHILKMVGLVHLRRYYKNVYIIELSCFLMYFYFGLKGYSEALNK